MGVVYSAHDETLRRDVAVKVLPPSFATDPDRLRRFEQEARAAGALNHPNILAIHDFGEHERSPYVVSELLEGRTLREQMAGRALPVRKAVECGIQIARGLSAAHDKGIVHRDLKPENLFITTDGRVKILDFGIAKLTRPERLEGDGGQTAAPTQTEAGVVLGTTGYMSPEQVRGETFDHRSDIFALGAVLYEMLSGRRAFRGDSPADTMSAILKDDPPDLTLVAKEIPPVLERIVHRCLEKSPDQRFRSAHDLAFSLESISTVSGTPADGAASTGPGAAGEARTVRFQSIAFSRGRIYSARFTADGQTVVYGAAWEGEPLRLYMKRPETPDPISLMLPSADLLATSPTGETAIQLHGKFAHAGVFIGTLAVAPLFGGAPRQVAEGVTHADYAPSGNGLLVVREVEGRSRIEYPIGRVLYESVGHVSYARFSPRVDRIAFLDHPLLVDDRSSVAMIDLEGKETTLTRQWASAQGLAWSPSGDEVWFAAAEGGASRSSLYAVNLSGELRQVYAFAGTMRLHDIAKSGRVLLTLEHMRCGIIGKAAGETKERDLTWLDWSSPAEISLDGKTLLFDEQNESVGRDYAVCIRGMDGSPVIRLGEGSARALSPDGRWAAARTPHADAPLVLWPTGPGQRRVFETPGVQSGRARWMSDSRRLVVVTLDDSNMLRRVAILDVEDGSWTPLSLETVGRATGLAISPDDRLAVLSLHDRAESEIVPLDGSPGRKGPMLGAKDAVVAFSTDGEWIYVQRGAPEIPLWVDRVHLERGYREAWREFVPADVGGLVALQDFTMALDGEAHAYRYQRILSELYIAEGLA